MLHNIIFLFFFFILLGSNFLKASYLETQDKKIKTKESILFLKAEERKVRKLINQYIKIILKKDYKLLLELTTGSEKIFYKEFIKKSETYRNYHRKVNNPMKQYFKDYKGYKIDFVYVDLEFMKSIVYCDFEFNYHDYLKRKISKIRRVYYYLEKKQSKDWKIASSKLQSEFLSYRDSLGTYWFR